MNEAILAAFAAVAKLTPASAHPSHAAIFTDGLTAAQKAPAPGFVGADYRPGGVLFVAKNGALGTAPEHRRQDEETARLWSELAAAGGAARAAAFARLMAHLCRASRTWNLNRYIAAFGGRTGRAAESFALLNLIAFRTPFKEVDKLRGVYEEAWRGYAGALMAALAPALIVPLGNDQAKQLAKLYRGPGVVSPPIRRSIGDRFTPRTLPGDIDAAAALLGA